MTTVTQTPRRSLSVPTAWTRGTAGVLIMFGLVELFTRLELVNPDYLPPASSVVAESVRLLGMGEFWDALASTMLGAALGLLRAIVIAVPLGLLLGMSRWAYRAAITVVEVLRPIPSVALIPLAILLYGTGTAMKAFLVTYACVWPILFNTLYGMHDVDHIGTDTAKTFGLGPLRRTLRVSLPAASPFIYTGIKIASSVALILAISAEIVAGGQSGLGIEMGSARALGNVKLSYAYITLTGVIGIILYAVLEAVERKLFAWNRLGQAER